MGRSRQMCYAMNAERKRRENGEEERRPWVMPLLGRGIRFQDSNSGMGSRQKISILITWQEGEVGHSLHLNHFYKYIIEDSPIACHTAWQLDLAMWLTMSSSQD